MPAHPSGLNCILTCAVKLCAPHPQSPWSPLWIIITTLECHCEPDPMISFSRLSHWNVPITLWDTVTLTILQMRKVRLREAQGLDQGHIAKLVSGWAGGWAQALWFQSLCLLDPLPCGPSHHSGFQMALVCFQMSVFAARLWAPRQQGLDFDHLVLSQAASQAWHRVDGDIKINVSAWQQEDVAEGVVGTSQKIPAKVPREMTSAWLGGVPTSLSPRWEMSPVASSFCWMAWKKATLAFLDFWFFLICLEPAALCLPCVWGLGHHMWMFWTCRKNLFEEH